MVSVDSHQDTNFRYKIEKSLTPLDKKSIIYLCSNCDMKHGIGKDHSSAVDDR